MQRRVAVKIGFQAGWTRERPLMLSVLGSGLSRSLLVVLIMKSPD